MWFKNYNEERPHSGRYCYGTTPTQTFRDSMQLVTDKMLGNTQLTTVWNWEANVRLSTDYYKS